MVQVSDDAELDRILGVRKRQEISYGPQESWHGMQVKLRGAHKWKITVAITHAESAVCVPTAIVFVPIPSLFWTERR